MPGFRKVNIEAEEKRPWASIECGNIQDVLECCYKTAQDRLVDSIYQQAVDFYPLIDEDGPLHVFNPGRVMAMTPEQLEAAAGEVSMSRNKRERIPREITELKEAQKIPCWRGLGASWPGC